jgi:hypothetical protein
VRRLILVGTGPGGHSADDGSAAKIFGATYDPPENLWLAVHFTPPLVGQVQLPVTVPLLLRLGGGRNPGSPVSYHFHIRLT